MEEENLNKETSFEEAKVEKNSVEKKDDKEHEIPEGFCELTVYISNEENFGRVTFDGVELVGVKSDFPHSKTITIRQGDALPTDICASPINEKFFLAGWSLNGDNVELIKGDTIVRNNERVIEAIRNNKKVDICAKFQGKRMSFYIVNTYKKKELKVRDALIQIKKNYDDAGNYNIGRKLVAVTQVPIKDRKTKLDIPGKFKDEFLYPGYLFVEMDMDDKTWFDVRNAPDVTGISGSTGGRKPTPVSKEEMEPVFKRLGLAEKSMFDKFHIGDEVVIINGPLAGNNAVIKSIDPHGLRFELEINWFGKTSTSYYSFENIEKK